MSIGNDKYKWDEIASRLQDELKGFCKSDKDINTCVDCLIPELQVIVKNSFLPPLQSRIKPIKGEITKLKDLNKAITKAKGLVDRCELTTIDALETQAGLRISRLYMDDVNSYRSAKLGKTLQIFSDEIDAIITNWQKAYANNYHTKATGDIDNLVRFDMRIRSFFPDKNFQDAIAIISSIIFDIDLEAMRKAIQRSSS
jgi:hypothetical protein